MKELKGYKVFFSDWTGTERYQYKVGEIFEIDEKPRYGRIGFHFYLDVLNCFDTGSFNIKDKVAEVIALGDVDYNEYDNHKCCTNKIKIVWELSWHEMLTLASTGCHNSGYGNSGNSNSGDYNSGNRNSGYYNRGSFNSGKRNAGDYNSGEYNSGSHNSGSYNSGERNSGNFNGGNDNSGYRNSGNHNSGVHNSGSYNSGSYNSGNGNSGRYNSEKRNSGRYYSGYHTSGNSNSGNYNSGSHNSGSFNSGDFNTCNYSAGCFNTKEQKIYLFNKPSDWTYTQWRNSEAYYITTKMKLVDWNSRFLMTEEEKQNFPQSKVTEGYLKVFDFKTACKQWWDGLTEEEKDVIKAIPNFDAAVFKEITGIDEV